MNPNSMLVFFIALLLFLVFREVFTWYWKMNEVVKNQKVYNKEFREFREDVAALEHILKDIAHTLDSIRHTQTQPPAPVKQIETAPAPEKKKVIEKKPHKYEGPKTEIGKWTCSCGEKNPIILGEKISMCKKCGQEHSG